MDFNADQRLVITNPIIKLKDTSSAHALLREGNVEGII